MQLLVPVLMLMLMLMLMLGCLDDKVRLSYARSETELG